MTKILANYKMVNPDKPEPEKDQNGQLTEKGRFEVVAFMKEMGYGGMGSSASLLAAQAAKAKERAEHDKKTDSTAKAPQTYLGAVADLQQQLPKTLTVGELGRGYIGDLMNKDGGDQFNALFDEKFTNKARIRSTSSVNESFIGKVLDSPRELYDWMSQDEMSIRDSRKLAVTKADSYNLIRTHIPELGEDGTIEKFTPEETDFKANGQRMKEGMLLSDDKDRYSGKMKALGVVTAWTTKAKNGKEDGEEIILMDAYNGDEYDEDATNKMYPGMEDTKAELSYMIALENEEGDLVYRKLNVQDPAYRKALGDAMPSNDISSVISEDSAKKQERLNIQALDDKGQVEVETAQKALEPIFAAPLFKTEGEKYHGAGSGGQENRYGMMRSYYMALDYIGNKYNTGSGAISTKGVQSMIDKNIFTTSMKMGNVEEDLRDYSKSADVIAYKWLEEINALEEPGSLIYKRNEQIANRWMQYNNAF